MPHPDHAHPLHDGHANHPPPQSPKAPPHHGRAGVNPSPHHQAQGRPPGGADSRRQADHRGHAGHDRHAGHSVDMFRDRFWLSAILTIPVVLWSEPLQHWLGYTPPPFPGSGYLPAVVGTFIYLYGGLVFIRGAVSELGDRVPGMMTLIALAISVAFVYSAAVTLGIPGMALWWELATLVTIMLLGHWIEMQSIAQARGAVRELGRLLPSVAHREPAEGGPAEAVPLSALRDGDRVLIRPGDRVPADGVVRQGESQVNESMITGESRPVSKRPGDAVTAGTVNGSGSLRVEVTGTGDRTALAGIMRLVQQAQQSRSRAQALADRAAFALTLVAVGAGLLTLASWLVAGAGWPFAIERVVTVLVIACPHALGLAIPLRGGHLDHRRRRAGPPGARPPGAGGRAERGRRGVRQDGHPDPRRVPRGRFDGGRGRSRRRPGAGGGCRARFRAHGRAGHRAQRRGARACAAHRLGLPIDPRARRSRAGRGPRGTRRRAGSARPPSRPARSSARGRGGEGSRQRPGGDLPGGRGARDRRLRGRRRGPGGVARRGRGPARQEHRGRDADGRRPGGRRRRGERPRRGLGDRGRAAGGEGGTHRRHPACRAARGDGGRRGERRARAADRRRGDRDSAPAPT